MPKHIEPYIIGIGASAGGLETVSKLISTVPEDTLNCYVIIQHLSSEHKSHMQEIIAKNTQLPIEEVNDITSLKPGHVYLIPPSKNLTLAKNHLKLSEKPKNQHLNLPIDIFFASLAREKKEKSIAVILTGTGSDGTRGGREIKENGGLVLVQDPTEAKFDGMPASALLAGIVDYTLPVSEISDFIDAYIEKRAGSSEDILESEKDDETLSKILRQVYDKTGKDFSQYKKPTMARRIERRMDICKCRDIQEYLNFLYENAEEAGILSQELLIGVTKFFRDSEVWENIKKKALRNLILKKNKENTELRVWCIGCSTGEEVYTIAILIHEMASKLEVNLKIKIFATDLEKKYIDIASKGLYPESIVADIPATLLNKYFNCKNGSYTICEQVRKTIIFTQHDILTDPPFNNIDLAVCRNLLIYLNHIAQQKALSAIQYSLNVNSYLQLGPSESLGSLEAIFGEVSRRHKLYQNKHKSTTIGVHSLGLPGIKSKPRKTQTVNIPGRQTPLAELITDSLIDELELTAIFIDSSYNIVHAVGDLRRYLEMPKSGFSTNLLKILPDAAAAAVNTAVKKSTASQEKIIYKDVKLQLEDQELKIDILVSPVKDASLSPDYVSQIIIIPRASRKSKIKAIKNKTGQFSNERIHELEGELKDTRDNLQATIEEVETTNEELQATNEELLAANEELQSTNEELQSVNEELYTVNAEYQQKFEDLTELNADMDNLLSSTEIGTIFLDSSLTIRKFTPAVKDQFNLQETDVGRPLSHFTGNMKLEDSVSLMENVQKVIKNASQINKEICTENGDWFLVRTTPFKSSTGKIDGAVMSFVDISELKTIENKYHDQNIAFEQVLEGTMAGYWDWNIKEDTEYLSPYFKKMLGYEDHEMENSPKAWMDIVHPDDLQSVLDTFDDHVKSQGKIPYDNEVRYFHKNGGVIWVYCRGKVIEWDDEGQPVRMVGSHVDITSLKNEIELEKKNEELKQFAYITSHDLQEPVNTVISFANLLREDYKGKLDDDADKCLDFISNAANRMGSQIKGLLEYSRLGRQNADSFINLNTVLKDIIKDLNSAILESKADVSVSKLPKVKATEYDMRALFLNLMTNAIKFRNKNKKLKIDIDCKKEEKRWIISISDNGIGIPKQYKEKIFHIFQRLHSSNDYKGDGIGLANCRKVVEHLGGEIWVNSRAEKGSVFLFSLPCEIVKK